jgi:hypothetical protein
MHWMKAYVFILLHKIKIQVVRLEVNTLKFFFHTARTNISEVISVLGTKYLHFE